MPTLCETKSCYQIKQVTAVTLRWKSLYDLGCMESSVVLPFKTETTFLVQLRASFEFYVFPLLMFEEIEGRQANFSN